MSGETSHRFISGLLVGASLVGGLWVGAALVERPAEAVAAPQSEGSDTDVADAIEDLTSLLIRWDAPGVIGVVRDRQTDYLRANQAFPDYIEVGIGAWYTLYDWQIRTRQVPNIVVTTEGRYVMSALLGNFVLRINADPGYVGVGSDRIQ